MEFDPKYPRGVDSETYYAMMFEHTYCRCVIESVKDSESDLALDGFDDLVPRLMEVARG